MAEPRTKALPRPLLLNLDEAMAALGGVSRTVIYQLMSKGKLKTVRVGGRRMVPVAEVERVAREGTD